jgi:hypothetical protein
VSARMPHSHINRYGGAAGFGTLGVAVDGLEILRP